MDALKSSSVNSKYWDRLAEYVEQPDYRQTLVMPTWHAQDPGFVDRVHERMIAIKDTPDPSVYSRELQHSVTETAVDYVLKNTGYMLHALQDFYSHTNWIDGPDLIPLYEYYYIRRAAPINQILIQQTFIVSFLVYEDLGESALIAQSSAASRHSNTLNLANLEAGLTDISLSPHRLIYFDGGFEPSGIRKSSQHGRYAVDAAGLGRDSSQAHSVGLFETFERAKSLGVKQTTDVLRWVEQRIPACVRKELFSRSNEK